MEEDDEIMRKKIERPYEKSKDKTSIKESKEDLFELCLKKGLIEKTEYGYYFKPEFFETLELYDIE